ncbi:MAG: bifunctional 5,10-methylenetetrahydrofolate dehydrogenase/5,10-methenyltetrahydrofolate cyclohydrolase, partial [Bacteroidetes bacterium]
MQWLDGKQTAREIRQEIQNSVMALRAQGHRAPRLVLLLVGNDPASATYVGHKLRAGQQVGFEVSKLQLPAHISQAELETHIRRLNEDESVDALLLQTPLPPQLDPDYLSECIAPLKDVDVLHPHNVGLLAQGRPYLLPPTPAGIVELLRRYRLPVAGKHAVVIGRSQLVGRPLSLLLSGKGEYAHATLSLCHSQTPRPLLRKLCSQADLLVAAAGSPGLVTADMVKTGAIVIDVGSTWLPDASR